VIAILNTDHDITSAYQVTVFTISPTDFTLNISGLDIDEGDNYSFRMGNSAYLSGTFLPSYTTNTAIEIVFTADDEILEIINNSSTTITIKATKVGSITLTIASVANPSITKTLTITVTAQTYINENNYNEYAMTTRKFLGHFLLFGVTTIIGFLFFKYSFETNSLKEDILPGLFSIGNGMLVVFISEFFQALVPSRGPSLTDIGIDTLGSLIFAILMMTLFLIIRLIRHKKIKPRKYVTRIKNHE
jgi:VanZ family protein